MHFRSLVAAALLAATLPAIASDPQRHVCTGAPEYEYDVAYYPRLTKTCSDVDSPLETCTSFTLSASGDPSFAYDHEQAGIRSVDGVLEFHPVGLSSYERRAHQGPERLGVLSLIDNSGSASRAEERFAVLDGAFKAVAPLMDYAAKEAFMARQPLALDPTDEPLTCAPAKR